MSFLRTALDEIRAFLPPLDFAFRRYERLGITSPNLVLVFEHKHAPTKAATFEMLRGTDLGVRLHLDSQVGVSLASNMNKRGIGETFATPDYRS